MSDLNLTNKLLIAMPALEDANFSQTIALICGHSEQGALGIVLNRPLPMRLGQVFEQMLLDSPSPTWAEQAVLRGGPIEPERGFVIHRPEGLGEGPWDSTMEVSASLHVTTSKDILMAIAAGQGPAEAIVALGYAGWDAGQLENEIRQNAWLVSDVSEDVVFRVPFNQRWQAGAALLGVDLKLLTRQAGHA
jgi:putative transcriptional regulator